MKSYWIKFNKTNNEVVDVVKEKPDYEKWHYGKDMKVEEMVKLHDVRWHLILSDIAIVLMFAFIVWRMS